MKAVIQRTKYSEVVINHETVGTINQGLVVLLGIKKDDNMANARYIVDKIYNLRIFEDEEGKMNRSLLDIKGEIMIVSQFTLYGDTNKGRRPSFIEAADPAQAEPLFNALLEYAHGKGLPVQTGQFGASMQVHIVNDGPCTIILESK